METKLNIHGVKIIIESDDKIGEWLKHDYHIYIDKVSDSFDLNFNLHKSSYNRELLPNLQATTYHDDYIVYDSGDLRVIDFLNGGLSIFKTNKKEIDIYHSDVDKLYEIFCLAFTSLLGEELDKKGFHRIHCLALERDGLATILLLPPGAGKTTLALRFLNNQNVRVLAEDIVLYKNGNLFGLHFRWGVRNAPDCLNGRTMSKKDSSNKLLLNVADFNLAQMAKPCNIILGKRTTSSFGLISSINKLKLFLPLFKSMVLGLELQQSLAYFLLRNYKDFFLKSNIGMKRLMAMFFLIYNSKTFVFSMGQNIDKNYTLLDKFITNND